MSHRSLVGPVVGGVLYNRFGIHGPGILAIVVTAVDLIGRLLIIERKAAILCGVDPAKEASSESEAETVLEQVGDGSATETAKQDDIHPQEVLPTLTISEPALSRTHLSLIDVVRMLATSPRALTVMFCTAIYGSVILKTLNSKRFKDILQNCIREYRTLAPSASASSVEFQLFQSWVGIPCRSYSYFDMSVPALQSVAHRAYAYLDYAASPLSGWLTDRIGPEWVINFSTALSLPWFGLLTVQATLVLFIAVFCVGSM